MTINPTDIKLLESERMTDNSDGGGRRRSIVIPDGIAGNIFPKVSRLDATYGRVNLRKVYGAVQTANLDVYAGAHAAITDAPDNNRIHVNLFSTSSDFDTRTAARDRIESYVTAGPESRMVLYGRQLIGQQSVLVYQRTTESLPEVGEVLCLSKETGGTVVYQQYVRMTEVESVTATFTDTSGDFQRTLVTITIGAPLRYEFAGPETPSRLSDVLRDSKVRVTNVADASRYFGIQKLTEAVLQNDLTAMVATVYSPIVPTTQRETAISLASIAGATQILTSSLVPFTTQYTNANWAVSGTLGGAGGIRGYFGAVTPGSVSFEWGWFFFGWNGYASYDQGDGTMSGTNAEMAGTINYETGELNLAGDAYVTGASYYYYVTRQPAAIVTGPAHTREIAITLGTRGTVYTEALNPLPAPGTLFVDYRALGKWYRLRDNGLGELRGSDDAYGVGSIVYATGGLVVTLGALPDLESSVIVSWGSPVHYTVRAGTTSDASASVLQEFTLLNRPVQSNTLTVTYTSGAVQYTATTNASGVITGNGLTGLVDPDTGIVKLAYTVRMPDVSTLVQCAYQQIEASNPVNPTIVTEAQVLAASFSLSSLPAAGSVKFQALVSGSGFSGNVRVEDNGVGQLVVPAGQIVPRTYYVGQDGLGSGAAVTSGNEVVGTINYATGGILLNNTVALQYAIWAITGISGGFYTYGWQTIVVGVARSQSYTSSVVYRPAGASSILTAETENFAFTAAPLKLDLLSTIGDSIMPGSLVIALGGKTMVDRSGTLYSDVNPSTGAGIVAGTVNYRTGEAELSYWTNGAALAFALQGCLTTFGDFTVPDVFFRTAGSPVRPASFYVQATSETGVLLTGTSDQNGVVTGTYCRGNINQTMGVARVQFGEMVAAAGNENESWYMASNVVGPNVWRPIPVFPSTIRYNCVVLSNLPLNADILGLDPVRLPADGRVPIYRPADVVVVHNTKSLTLPNPVVANTTYDCGRDGLAELWLVDQANVKVPTANYTVDLINGTITMAAVLSLGGLTQPFRLKHRQEELNLLADVQINGQLTLTQPLARDYDATDTFVSSALLFGDMNARVTGVYDQATWTNVWSDALIGSQATGQYNDVDYPIEVRNDGAVRERWRVTFTSTTAFQVVGENIGVIGSGNTGQDFTIVNALTGLAYFTLRAAGWGLGWSVGNQLRFNTIGATAPIWIARTILPGATLLGDSFDMQLRGDVDG